MPLPAYYRAKLGHSRSNDTCADAEIPEKLVYGASRLSRSLKVTGTDTDQSATYDFVLLIRGNHMGLSRTVYNINGD